jgi:hypothetical protein
LKGGEEVGFFKDRGPELWIGKPPPEKGSEIGVGKENVWQTLLHREAVRRV